MKATVIRGFGGPEVFLHADVPDPQPAQGELLIRVRACGINRYDLYLRMGAVFTDMPLPHVMGADVAGEVAVIGPGVSDWTVGERAIAAPGYPLDPADWSIKPENAAPSFEVTGTHSWGGYAEYIRMPARFVLKDRTNLPPEEVAAMPLVLMTAVHAVETLGDVKEGTTVLVHAGMSGSGNACLQLAKVLGARVATTVGSPEKAESARKCGADLVINYNADDFARAVLDWTNGSGVDVVIDNVGASVFAGSLEALRPGGIYVNFGLVGGMKTTLNLRDLFFRRHQLRGSFMGSLRELKRGLAFLAERRIRPILDRRYPLREAGEAHRYIESRAIQGKVVLIP
jgi:NADPH:quinone reductase-like Zn-dependent oxidoreductase